MDEIERSLLVCFGKSMGLRMCWMIEQDQGVVMNHPV